jgi:putative endonuclease
MMDFLKALFPSKKPIHQQYGEMGEKAARKHLQKLGLKYLTANYRSDHGEIDLIFREGHCMVFVEVKTRSSEQWTRPANAVDADKQQRISLGALDYMRLLKNPHVSLRFDIVEVLLKDGKIDQIRHISNAFPLSPPLRYADCV